LGYHEKQPDVFEATMCFAVVDGYAPKSQSMPAKAVATWANGFFFQLTEAMLQYDGIPVKYMGDTFLGFFSGPDHQQRAVRAAFRAKEIVSDSLTTALNCGEIYLGSIGHPDYARPDIMGDTVNLAFMTMGWAAQHLAGQITVTASILSYLPETIEPGSAHSVKLRELEEPVKILELTRML
jgi:class 3 adenylate cyclase